MSPFRLTAAELVAPERIAMESRVRLPGAVDAKDFRSCRCNEIGNGNYAWNDRQPKNVRIRTDLTDQIPIATGIQIARDRGVTLPTNSLQRASANATITASRIAAQRTTPSSGGTKQCTKVPVVGHSYTNSHSPELRDCNRSALPQLNWLPLNRLGWSVV